MGRAVNHSFLDQLGPNRSEAGDLDTQGIRDIACALSPRPKRGHGAQEVLFTGREAVEAHPEEILVEARDVYLFMHGYIPKQV